MVGIPGSRFTITETALLLLTVANISLYTLSHTLRCHSSIINGNLGNRSNIVYSKKGHLPLFKNSSTVQLQSRPSSKRKYIDVNMKSG